MSNLKRPLTKNCYLSLTGKEPVLNNYNLYNNFPIGLMIISKQDPISCREGSDSNEESSDNQYIEIKIKFINQQASELFEIKENDSIQKIHDQLKLFKKFDKTQKLEQSLDSILFNSDIQSEYYGSFKSQASFIYVKFKAINDDLYICTDYYTDERKIIQNQLFQSLKFQYIATLFHELYNPINALLFMIDINQNEKENKEAIINSNLGKSDLDESHFSELTENEFDKINLDIQDNEINSINRKIDVLYKSKLSALNEKEKDIGLLVNMIYIFLQNLILYLRINLGVNFKVNEINQNKEENNKQNEEAKINNLEEEGKNNKNIDNIYSDNYLTLTNKKLNLEVSFYKHLDKFSYLFNFKNIQYCTDFSYLSDKYIITDESLFLDFLGQLYSFLYYIVPKSKGFELSYSIINDNKLKILFLKTDCPKKSGYRFHKSRKSNSCLIGEFKATSTVKTCEMTQEILYKLSEILGIKTKIMEYEDQKEDKYLTIIMPFFFDQENDLLDSEIDELPENYYFGRIPHLEDIVSKNVLSQIYENQNKDTNNILKKGNTKKNNKNFLTLSIKSKNSNNNSNIKKKNVNYLNPNFYRFSMEKKATFLVDEVEERNSSEEDISSQKESDSKGKENDNNNTINNEQSKLKDNNNNYIKQKKRLSVLSKISNNKSKSPLSCAMKINNFKEMSNKYLKEISPIFSQKDLNISNQNYKANTNVKTNKNFLTIIHEKYSNLERLKSRGIEILKEKESKPDDKNKSLGLDSVKPCGENTSLKDKKSISAENDSENYIEIENVFLDIDNEVNKNINNTINQIQNNSIHNNSFLLNIKKINNNISLNRSVNDNLSQEITKNSNQFSSQKPSNKTLDCNKRANNHSLYAITEINDNSSKKIEKSKVIKNNIPVSNCNCKDILLVDDDEFILKTSKNILKHFKLEADSAENGQECLNIIKTKQEKNCNCSKNKYKIILMDITMPIMDGIEAAKNIQKLIDENKLYDSIKIIFISAHVNLDLTTILSGIKCAVDYYAKPISRDKYKNLLDKYYYSNNNC